MATIQDLLVSAKYMANDNRYQYGRWNGKGNNTAANPSDGFHYDCGTAVTWVIRDAKNGHKHDNTPFSTYIWPNNDGSPYFDSYLLNNGFTRHNYNKAKALSSGYAFIPVVGRYHVWSFYEKLQFEANDGYGSGAASIDIHNIIDYSDALYMYYPTGWDKGAHIKNGLSDEPEADGKWAYYTNGKVDTSVTGVYQNCNGWWYVKDGYVDFNYWGLATNQYGTWVIEAGKVNFDARTGFYEGTVNNVYGFWWCEHGKVQTDKNDVLKDPYDGNWRYVKGGKFTEYNGIASNKNGLWRIVNGMVDFTDGDFDVIIQVKDGYVMHNPKEQS